MVYGTVPSSGVKLDTKFVKNVLEHVLARQDPVKKSAELPGVFDQIKADDAKFEISVSNTVERLELFHRISKQKAVFKNEVGEVLGYIFVNTKVKDLKFSRNSINKDINCYKARNMSE